jgi:hypothetical protein
MSFIHPRAFSRMKEKAKTAHSPDCHNHCVQFAPKLKGTLHQLWFFGAEGFGV